MNIKSPGILGIYEADPQTARALQELIHHLLRRESALSLAERESLAAYVSWRNKAEFCYQLHSTASAVFGGVKTTPRVIAMLKVAQRVIDIKRVTKNALLSDQEVFEIAQIAAAMCMYNRLCACINPNVPEDYSEIVSEAVVKGYFQETE